MAINQNAKFYLIAGAGLAAGALALLSLTRNNKSSLRKSCVSLLSHGLDLKDKMTVAAEIAKESLEDLTAEARYESDARKMKAAYDEDLSDTEDTAEIEAVEKVKAAKKSTTRRTSSKTTPKTA